MRIHPVTYLIQGISLLFLLSTMACRSDHPVDIPLAQQNNARIAQLYFAEHSPTTLSRRDPLVFIIKKEIAHKTTDAQPKGMRITPHINGTWTWEGPQHLRFTPAEPLAPETAYTVHFEMNQLLPDVSDAAPFEWTFYTRPLQFDIEVGDLIIEENTPSSYQVIGQIIASDYVARATIQDMISIEDPDQSLQIEWQHNDDGTHHPFVIRGIPQQEKDHQISVVYDGSKIDQSFFGKRNILIPGKHAFRLTDYRVQNQQPRSITLFFNHPLDPTQHLDGLIKINGSAKDITHEVQSNSLILYIKPTPSQAITLELSDKIKNKLGAPLQESYAMEIHLGHDTPQLRALQRGHIIPAAAQAIFAVETMNIKKLNVEVYKIYKNNIIQFLQNNDIDGYYQLQQVGKRILQDQIDVQRFEEENIADEWIRVGIDLSTYKLEDPDAIYQVVVGFLPQHTITDCDDSQSKPTIAPANHDFSSFSQSYYYNYKDRDNPCHEAFYNPNRYIKRNLLLSDLGVIAKIANNGNIHIHTSSLTNGKPVGEAQISVFDYQQQEITSGRTSPQGSAVIPDPTHEAHFVTITSSAGVAYLKLDDANSNSLSDFEVSGRHVKQGIDGYCYTERGVYRPGDTIHLYFMYQDKGHKLPKAHPVKLSLYDARGNMQYQKVTQSHVSHIYSWHIPTHSHAITGQWRATIDIGPHQFFKTIPIETIRPNRLKIDIQSPYIVEYAQPSKRYIDINATWLHGAPASDLHTKVNLALTHQELSSPQYQGFNFSDPARKKAMGLVPLYDGKLDKQGHVRAKIKIDTRQASALLKGHVVSKVFEKGGNYSEQSQPITISPFDTYVGVKIPQSRWGFKNIPIKKPKPIAITTLNDALEPKGNRKLTVGVYDVNWRWWYYESDRHNIYKFNSTRHHKAIVSDSITTDATGSASYTIPSQKLTPGRKLIRICDRQSGHCTGDFFYASEYSYYQPNNAEKDGLAKLQLQTDKTTYQTGEEVVVQLPSEKGGKVLLSIESNQEVLLQEWIDCQAEQTTYRFRTNAHMTPNVYIHALMVQPYATKQNDLPIRMYGVAPIMIENPETRLQPIITMEQKELTPNGQVHVEVTEKQGRPMAYTVAIVDEGLLDITNFQTPNPFTHFYAKQSLGVKTWDTYHRMLSGLSDRVDRIISVGGDATDTRAPATPKAMRFKPVVLTSGPHQIGAGQTQSHRYTLPNYIGAVKVMVVARNEDAYGSTHTTRPVTQPVMILPALPRVLGPNEIIDIPVHVFVMKNGVKTVDVTLQANPDIELISAQKQTVHFDKEGEKTIFFKVKTKNKLGITDIKFDAEGGRYRADYKASLDIRNPNAPTTITDIKTIAPGETWTYPLQAHGLPGTNESVIEVNRLFPLDLSGHLDYLLRYPYGCIEQTISQAFPQLYLDVLLHDNNIKADAESNINAAIRRIVSMQNSDGGFTYWPQQGQTHAWSTSYAGHFLLEAIGKGYYVPSYVMTRWKNHQQQQSQSFRMPSHSPEDRHHFALPQAYRLYTLALAGDPDLTAMNVMLQQNISEPTTHYLLAACYALAGKKTVAIEMLQKDLEEIPDYHEHDNTFGSRYRDRALIAQCMLLLDRSNEAMTILQDISKELSAARHMTTQEAALALITMGKVMGSYNSAQQDMSFTLSTPNDENSITNYTKPIYVQQFNPDPNSNKPIKITNHSQAPLYVKISNTGQLDYQQVLAQKAYNQYIQLDQQYLDLNGQVIDPSALPVGTDIIVKTTIKNLGKRQAEIKNLALTQIFPSGWEIQARTSAASNAMRSDPYTYRDQRDDRVNTFFDLRDKKTFYAIVTTSYPGHFILPAVTCEAMYDASYRARTKAQKVKVLAHQ